MRYNALSCLITCSHIYTSQHHSAQANSVQVGELPPSIRERWDPRGADRLCRLPSPPFRTGRHIPTGAKKKVTGKRRRTTRMRTPRTAPCAKPWSCRLCRRAVARESLSRSNSNTVARSPCCGNFAPSLCCSTASWKQMLLGRLCRLKDRPVLSPAFVAGSLCTGTRWCLGTT